MYRHLLLCLSAPLFFTCPKASAQTDKPYSKEVRHKIRQVENNLISWVKLDSAVNWNLRQRMKELNVQGLSIAVIDRFRIQWVKGYGWADTTQKMPVGTGTLFQSASIGKSLNGWLFTKLAAEGRLDMDKDINAYLKRWRFPYDSVQQGSPITVAQLLSHTAGLNVHGFDGYKWTDSLPGLPKIIQGQRPANNPAVRGVTAPGTAFEYSGGGYEVSELLAEDLTGLSYAELMHRMIFRPLYMRNSTYRLHPASPAATGYRADGASIGCRYHLYPEKACGAGLWTTAGDIARFIIGVQQSLAGEKGAFPDSAAARRMLLPRAPARDYGLGFFINEKGEQRYFQHSGLNEGFSSQYYGSMQGGRGVVVLTNSDNSALIEEIVNSVALVYGWKDFFTAVPKRIISVPDSIASRYVGRYRFQHEETGPVISMDNGQLYLLAPGASARWHMYFTSLTEFFMLEARGANQQFFMDENGKVKGHYIIGGDSREPVWKVD